MPRPVASDFRRFVPVFLTAALYVLAFPNFDLAPVAWFALIPLAVAARRSTPRQAFWLGWGSGTLAYGGILYWLIVTFQAAHAGIPLAMLSLAALSAYLGVFWGTWAAYVSAVDAPPLMRALLSAAAWIALELVRAYLFSGFPWALLGDSQAFHPAVIQIASWTGVYGISFAIVFVNLALAQAALEPHARRSLLGAAGLLAGAVLLFGYARLKAASALPSVPGLRVALLQGSIDQYKKWDKAYVDDIERTYENLALQAAKEHPALILWPETSVPGYLLQDPPLRDWLNRVIRQSGTSHIVGAPVKHDQGAYNSAFAIDPQGGIHGEYRKMHLVPFGEIVPWSSVLGRFIGVLNDLGGFTAGRDPGDLDIAGTHVAVNICYEAIFPHLVRRSVRRGAELIANLTNDGWYMQTAAPYQHFAPNILRAVENGRWLIRADNTGISAIIDPFGRVTAASPIFKPWLIEGTVAPKTQRTPYNRMGDWLPIAGALACLLGLGRSIRRSE